MLKAKNLYKFAFIAVMSLMAYAPVAAQEEVTEQQEVKEIMVDRQVHDFGTFGENDGSVTAVFVITNNTDAPIVLTNVRASCGCTTPNWTQEPIEPGGTGEIAVSYNPKGRPGPFEKVVTVTTNGNPQRMTMRIKGIVE
jgi:hypothetical protein